MKKYKTSFVLGKFYPPSKGHLYLIDTAKENSDKVYVLMGSLQRETIPGELRFGWLCDIYKESNVEIVWVQDENPQYPEEDPINFWNIWLETFKKYLPDNIDAIFSSEDYGFEIAKRMNIEHYLVDKDRTFVPISATKIRDNPFEYWDYIPDLVKSYFIKKVVIMGAESSGKTTMCKRLSETFNTKWVEEYGRFYTEEIKKDLDLNIEDFRNIAEGQIKNINETSDINKVLFCDTELITTKIFSELYCPENYKLLEPYFDIEIKKQKYDLYILLDISTTFVQDGNRRLENDRLEHYQMIKKELDKYGIKYYEILGNDYGERFDKILEIIKKGLL